MLAGGGPDGALLASSPPAEPRQNDRATVWTSSPIDVWLAVGAAPLVGSFLGVVVTRLPAGEGVILGRSRCPACGHGLGPDELVPVLSWVAQRGRCRHCAAPIPVFYPAIELAAVVVALWASVVVSGWLLWATCALGWALLALAIIDWRHLVLPDVLTLSLLAGGLAVAALLDGASVLDHAIGAAAGYAVLFVIGRLYARLRGREGLGEGDAKLLAAAGAWVSWEALAGVVFVASLVALAVALPKAVVGLRRAITEPLPFGPYLCLATWLTWLYGPISVTWPV